MLVIEGERDKYYIFISISIVPYLYINIARWRGQNTVSGGYKTPSNCSIGDKITAPYQLHAAGNSTAPVDATLYFAPPNGNISLLSW